MPRFRYTAFDSLGKRVSGDVEATSVEEVRAQLTAKGWRVESVEESSDEPTDASIDGLSKREVEAVGGHLADITQADLPLVPALKALAEDLPRGRLRRALSAIARKLESGADLATVVESHGTLAELGVLLQAGARSGRLADVLGQYVARVRDVSRAQRQALVGFAYPLFLLGMAAVVFASILIWVVPDFRTIFEDFGTELPAPTQSLLQLSQLLVESGFVVLLFGVAGCIALWLLVTRGLSASLRRRIVYRIPLLGPQLRWAALARFSDLLALLVENEVPMPEALRLAGNAAGDPQLREISQGIAQRVEAGQPIAEAARQSGGLPASFIQSLSWSEHEKALPEAIHATSEIHANRARIQSILIGNACEPIVVLMTGAVLGYMVISLFMPLVKLLNDLS